MYGYAEGGARKETDPTNPLTAYVWSKIGSEKAMAELDRKGMLVTSLRFATACGMSDRLRLDLVLNDFVACAITSARSRFQRRHALTPAASTSRTWRARFCGRSAASRTKAANFWR